MSPPRTRTWTRLNTEDAAEPDRSLEQGDVLEGCLVPLLPDNYGLESDLNVTLVAYRLMVLTQTCDLVQGREKLAMATLCRLMDTVEIVPADGDWSDPESPNKYREISRGHVPPFHIFEDWDQPDDPKATKIADFREVFTLPIDYLRRHAATLEKRPRLQPPYREHFAQAFARYHMRVGLPTSVPPLPKPPKAAKRR